jgi:hypothetical protein
VEEQTKKILLKLTVAALAITGTVVLYNVLSMNKKEATAIIVAKSRTTMKQAELDAYSESFLVSWAKALKAGKGIFKNDGKVFSTTDGMAFPNNGQTV